MQQEDDLRALAKIMEFGRAVSIFLLVVHVYVYCYPSIASWNLNLEVTDKIIMNFNNTTGIFNCDASFSFSTGGYWICPCPMRLSPHFMYSHWCPAIFAC